MRETWSYSGAEKLQRNQFPPSQLAFPEHDRTEGRSIGSDDIFTGDDSYGNSV